MTAQGTMSDPAVTRPLGSQRPNEATISTRATNVSTSSASGIATPATASSTQTMTETRGESQEVLRLTLRDRPNVTWDENVVDNEGMGRKSSKRCCIFHKERPFGESSTDSSDYEDEGDEGKKIAYKKLVGKKKTPDHLRFHA